MIRDPYQVVYLGDIGGKARTSHILYGHLGPAGHVRVSSLCYPRVLKGTIWFFMLHNANPYSREARLGNTYRPLHNACRPKSHLHHPRNASKAQERVSYLRPCIGQQGYAKTTGQDTTFTLTPKEVLSTTTTKSKNTYQVSSGVAHRSSHREVGLLWNRQSHSHISVVDKGWYSNYGSSGPFECEVRLLSAHNDSGSYSQIRHYSDFMKNT